MRAAHREGDAARVQAGAGRAGEASERGTGAARRTVGRDAGGGIGVGRGNGRPWVSRPGSSKSSARSSRRVRSTERVQDWHEVYLPYPAGRAREAGRPLHGLRHSVLSSGLSARQPDSGLERSGLPRSLARGDRSPARDQQLPRVHGQAVSRAVRRRVRPRHQRGSGHHQVDRGVDHRSRVGRGVGHAADAGDQHLQASRGRRLGPGRPGCCRPAQLRRTLGDRLREVGPHRGTAPLRDPRVQDGEALPRSAAGGHGSRRRGVQAGCERRRRRACRLASSRTTTPCCSPAAPVSRAIFRFPAGSSKASISRWST